MTREKSFTEVMHLRRHSPMNQYEHPNRDFARERRHPAQEDPNPATRTGTRTAELRRLSTVREQKAL